MAGKHAAGRGWRLRAERLAALCPRDRLHPAVVGRADSARQRGPWVVAFSGGADSLALLLLLWAHWPRRRARLRVVHFNHRLRGAAADRDEAFCRRVCAALGVVFRAGRHRLRRALRNAAEARAARFEFIGAAMKTWRARWLWLGHQQTDIAENMLMRLARGSGSAGLAAPRPVQAASGGRLHLRPLLTLRHEELTALLEQVKAPWREDDTNGRDVHFRNRIRRSVLPAWSRAADRDVLAGAARTRELLEEDDLALEAWVERLAPITADGCLDLTVLSGQPRAVVRRSLHQWLLRQRDAGELSRQAFDLLLAAVLAGKATRQSLGCRGFGVIRKGRLGFVRASRRQRNQAQDNAGLN